MNRITEAIQKSVERTISRKGQGLQSEGLWCMQTTRLLLEDAFDWDDLDIYKRLCTSRVGDNWKRKQWWAADFELSLRRAGYAIDPRTVQAGDIVFGEFPRPEGHVGIVFLYNGKLYVFENTTVLRGIEVKGANRITPLSQWEKITTAARLPESILPPLAPVKGQPVPPKEDEWPDNYIEEWEMAGPTGKVFALVQDATGRRKLWRVDPKKLGVKK